MSLSFGTTEQLLVITSNRCIRGPFVVLNSLLGYLWLIGTLISVSCLSPDVEFLFDFPSTRYQIKL